MTFTLDMLYAKLAEGVALGVFTVAEAAAILLTISILLTS